VQMGPEKKSRKIIERDKKTVAYHEAGHAIVGLVLSERIDVHMVTIVPRGDSGGHVQYLPTDESQFHSKQEIMDRVTMALGGRAAEVLVVRDITSGAVGDLQAATSYVRNMITKLGMSDRIGPVYYGSGQEVFLGKDFTQSRDYSEKIASMIDEEVRAMMEENLERAEKILSENMEKLRRLAELLLEKETVVREELEAIMSGQPIPEVTKRSRVFKEKLERSVVISTAVNPDQEGPLEIG